MYSFCATGLHAQVLGTFTTVRQVLLFLGAKNDPKNGPSSARSSAPLRGGASVARLRSWTCVRALIFRRSLRGEKRPKCFAFCRSGAGFLPLQRQKRAKFGSKIELRPQNGPARSKMGSLPIPKSRPVSRGGRTVRAKF